jgi:omega-amidase
MRNLNITPIQCELAWEQPEDNRAQLQAIFETLTNPTDLIILPEMFTTGFSMNALGNAEQPEGPTQHWMQEMAEKYNCALTGSIAVKTGESVFNRMLFVTPDTVAHYDKRHLFRMAGEHKRYASGDERVIVKWQGWRILLQVCYDLRFPVFSRNREDYDLAIYVANWPAKRSLHWRALLAARAIENLAYVIGVNRIGSDANDLEYSGDSLVVSADGELVFDAQNEKSADQVTLDGAALTAYRESFPCQLDADSFQLD